MITLKKFREINSSVTSLTGKCWFDGKKLWWHSVEKYTKTLSRWKNFRETTQQNYMNSDFTKSCFSTLRVHFWVILAKWMLETSIHTWIHSKQLLHELVNIHSDILYQILVNFGDHFLLWSAVVCGSFNVKLQIRPFSTDKSCQNLRKLAQKLVISHFLKRFYKVNRAYFAFTSFSRNFFPIFAQKSW